MICFTLQLIWIILRIRWKLNLLELFKWDVKGIDTSDFSGAVDHGARLSGRGLEGGAREWYQTDADGYLVVPYSHTANYPEPEKLVAGMDGMTNDLMPCMRMEYVPRDQLRNGFFQKMKIPDNHDFIRFISKLFKAQLNTNMVSCLVITKEVVGHGLVLFHELVRHGMMLRMSLMPGLRLHGRWLVWMMDVEEELLEQFIMKFYTHSDLVMNIIDQIVIRNNFKLIWAH